VAGTRIRTAEGRRSDAMSIWTMSEAQLENLQAGEIQRMPTGIFRYADAALGVEDKCDNEPCGRPHSRTGGSPSARTPNGPPCWWNQSRPSRPFPNLPARRLRPRK
jgi:hypothetical protein